MKSVNLDSWTPEQVQSMRVLGNSVGRAVYESNLPENYRRPQSDSSMEAFIRAKYDQKRYLMKDWVPPKIYPSDLPLYNSSNEKPTGTVAEAKKRSKKETFETNKTALKPPSLTVGGSTSPVNHAGGNKSPKTARKSPQPKTQNLVDLVDISGSVDAGVASLADNSSLDDFGSFIHAAPIKPAEMAPTSNESSNSSNLDILGGLQFNSGIPPATVGGGLTGNELNELDYLRYSQAFFNCADFWW